MAQATVNGIRLYYESHGAGAPLLLAAGLGGVGTYWAPQLPAFAAGRRVVLYDQRGSGRSAHTPVDSIEQLADDTIGLMDALDIARADYVGHSTGGAIGQVLAIEHPERLRRLVIYASVTRSDPYRERVWALRRQLLERLGAAAYAAQTSLLLYPHWWINAHHESLQQEEARTAGMLSAPDVMASRIQAILDFDRSADLGRIRTPTLVLCARDDILTPLYFSEALARSIPGARLVVIERGGHACSRTVPEAFNQHVLAFLDAQHASET